MAERIIGKYGTSGYGRLSILTQYRLNILKKFAVSPNCFFPKPKVDSTVIFFKPKNEILCKLKSVESLEKITNIFFSSKRKMINKNIKKIFKEEDLQELKNRLIKRNQESQKEVEKRFKAFDEDVLHWLDYDYVLINENLENCYKQIEKIISINKNIN